MGIGWPTLLGGPAVLRPVRTTSCYFPFLSWYNSFNAVFSKVGRVASQIVVIELLMSKCVPVLYYGSECCPVSESQFNSLEFALRGSFVNIFNTRSSLSTTLPGGGPAGHRGRGRSARRRPAAWESGGRHCTAGQPCYVPLGRHLVIFHFYPGTVFSDYVVFYADRITVYYRTSIHAVHVSYHTRRSSRRVTSYLRGHVTLTQATNSHACLTAFVNAAQ